jgi:hypothetical protein
VISVQDDLRQCEVKECWKLTPPLARLCPMHLKRRNHYGSPHVSRAIPRGVFSPYRAIVRNYLRVHPPTAETLALVTRFLEVPGRLRPGEVGYKDRNLLIREMERWSRPEFRFKYRRRSDRGLVDKYDYSATGYLTDMLAVSVFLHERDFRGWSKDDAPEYALVRAIVLMHRRPRWTGSKGHVEVVPVRPTVWRGLVKRWKSHTALSAFVTTTAEAIVKNMRPYRPRRDHGNTKERQARKRQIPVRVASPPPPAPPTRPALQQTIRLVDRPIVGPPVPAVERERIYHPPRYPMPVNDPVAKAVWVENERLWRSYPQGWRYR